MTTFVSGLILCALYLKNQFYFRSKINQGSFIDKSFEDSENQERLQNIGNSKDSELWNQGSGKVKYSKSMEFY